MSSSVPRTSRLLVIEDDPELGTSVSEGLEEYGYSCELARSGTEAIEAMEDGSFGIVILDLALSDDSALGVLRCIRGQSENSVVILLTPLDFRQERLAGLEAGADDFIIKPCAIDELIARIEAAQVRSRTRPKTHIEVGNVRMDLTARRVTRAGQPVSLTPTEFRILEILLRNHGSVVTRRMLCEFLWNPEWEGVTNVIEVHINRLRTKISAGNQSRLIHTVRGSGYMLRWDDDSADDSEAGVASKTENQTAKNAG